MEPKNQTLSDHSKYPVYNGGTGVFCEPDFTYIRLWAPTAEKVVLHIYEKGDVDNKPLITHHLIPSDSGTWTLSLDGCLHGLFYTIQAQIDGKRLSECPDIYAKAVGVNGKRGMFVNLKETDPPQWNNDQPVVFKEPVDAVLYELHVRDFSIARSSGISNKGKYLAFTENGTLSSDGKPTGIGHLKELGVTHVHLLPVFDFFTVDEALPQKKQYNWGYDPLNYNAPEGSYSTNAHDGSVRIAEFKAMVKSLHDNGLGVIMDVVYNHTGLTEGSWFNQIVPGYFYRFNEDGSFSDASGCGNEIATERPMVRKFIVDSLKYWAEEYHIDGFRFDLMGIFDIDTMNAIRYELDKINPDILLYGEGWKAGPSTLHKPLRAVKRNASQLDRIGAFSDDMRDALKGHWGQPDSKGFVSGLTLREEALKFGIAGAVYHPQINYNFVESSVFAWAKDPEQCINYVSCHDNYTLYDKLKFSLPDATEEELQERLMLAGAILLTSQGIPFLHAGVEFMRTKGGNPNSYKSPDTVNQIDWMLKSKNIRVFNYFRKLIHLRKTHPAFRMPSGDMIREKLHFLNGSYQPGTVAYLLGEHANADKWQWIAVLMNGTDEPVTLSIPDKKWQVIIQKEQIDETGLATHTGDTVTVPPITLLLLQSTK